jgi:protein-S-isoprenylcysteine O-methyltransferase Ste14
MRNDTAHKEGWQIFEVVFGIPFLVGVVMGWVVPLSLPRGGATLIFVPAGIALIILGIILVALARRELRRYGQPTDPGCPTDKIVTTGVFSFSRNPLYLGGICILAGLASALNLPWVIILLLPAFIACHSILIAPEEQYLAGKFGEEYRLYTEKVGRWIGRKR